MFVSAQSEDFMILACTALIGLQGVTDRRINIDDRYDAKYYMLSRVKTLKLIQLSLGL